MTEKSAAPPIFVSFQMEHTIISIDKALEFVGDNSTYQKRVMFLFSLQWVFYSFFMMGLPFLFATPSLTCPIQNIENPNAEIIYKPCFEAEACQTKGFAIDTVNSDPSITLEFGLICSDRIFIAICESLFFVGFHLISLFCFLFVVSFCL